MALPMNSTPVYELVVPSTGQKVKYRPFLIKEEKTLLIAQQSEDPVVMINSLKQVIESCLAVKGNEEVDVDQFATFDLEYIFCQLRAKSVGESIDLMLKCDTCTDEKAVAKVVIDLTQLEVIKPADHEKNIKLYDDVGVALKYPTIEVIQKLEKLTENNIDQIFDVVVECIDYVYTTDEVFHAKDQTKQELLDFVNNLSSEQFAKIQKFFETMPKMSKPVNYNCPVCGKKHDKVLEGLNSFF